MKSARGWAIATVVATGAVAACVGDGPVPSNKGGGTAADGDEAGVTEDGGAAPRDAAPDDRAGDDAARIDDAAVDGSDGGDAGGIEAAIRCDGVFCRGGDVCCVETSDGAYVGAACMPATSCATQYFECDSVHECPSNMVCCASTNGGSYVWASSECKTACVFPQRQLCDGHDECDGGCSAVASGIRPPNLRACPP